MSEFLYHTIGEPGNAEYKERGSKFLAYSFPVKNQEESKSRLQGIKKDHPKATHHCFAYRLGTDGLQFRCSDAGEPSGSAGKPILGQIQRLNITDVLVIVVRYFGGTLLGIPGLTYAYKTATALALQMTPVLTYSIERPYRLSFDYTVMSAVMAILRQYHCTVLREEMQLFCVLETGIPLAQEKLCLERLKEIRNLDIALMP